MLYGLQAACIRPFTPEHSRTWSFASTDGHARSLSLNLAASLGEGLLALGKQSSLDSSNPPSKQSSLNAPGRQPSISPLIKTTSVGNPPRPPSREQSQLGDGPDPATQLLGIPKGLGRLRTRMRGMVRVVTSSTSPMQYEVDEAVSFTTRCVHGCKLEGPWFEISLH